MLMFQRLVPTVCVRTVNAQHSRTTMLPNNSGRACVSHQIYFACVVAFRLATVVMFEIVVQLARSISTDQLDTEHIGLVPAMWSTTL